MTEQGKDAGEQKSAGKVRFYRSIVFKNLVLSLVILLVALVPMTYQYYNSSRAYEIRALASTLELFAERGSTIISADLVDELKTPADRDTNTYRIVLGLLRRIKRSSGVDNAIVMRRGEGGRYHYVAAAHDGFGIGQDADIHDLFPAAYRATEDTWQQGEMMHSRLIGGRVGDEVFVPEWLTPVWEFIGGRAGDQMFMPDWLMPVWNFIDEPESQEVFGQFVQINAPIKRGDEVVGILMLNKSADHVAQTVQNNTFRLLRFTVILLLIGLVVFGAASLIMLRPVRSLTAAAEQVSQGNLDVSLPAKRSRDEVGRLTVSFEGMLEGLRQRDFIRDTFGRYISEEIVDELLNSPDGLKLGGEVREVTFLVSDLRGFTALSSRLGPDEVIEVVNRFLEPMVEIITRHKGTVDEFQGDGILAFFGAPIAAADDPARAVACAVEMQRALVEINEEQARRGMAELHMGIGINTGEVIVGNIGSEKRTKYGAMGAAINMAYRIESNTVSGQVLISPDTYAKTSEFVRAGETQDLHFKGIEEPVRVYEVRGMSGPYACEMPSAAPEVFVAPPAPLPASVFEVEGKTVSKEGVRGEILKLSESGAHLAPLPLDSDESAGRFDKNANLMLRLGPETGVSSQIYARVTAQEADHWQVRFTSLPDDARAYFGRLRAEAGAAETETETA